MIEIFKLGKIGGGTTTVRLAKYQSPELDIFFIRKQRLNIIGELYVDGSPDLCVEVLSEKGRLHSKILPGFWLNPEWFKTFPLPPVKKTLQAIQSASNPIIQTSSRHNFFQPVRIIRDDAIHTAFEQAAHHPFIIHRPHVNLFADGVRAL